MAVSTGKVISVPPPATALTSPPPTAAAATATWSQKVSEMLRAFSVWVGGCVEIAAPTWRRDAAEMGVSGWGCRGAGETSVAMTVVAVHVTDTAAAGTPEA